MLRSILERSHELVILQVALVLLAKSVQLIEEFVGKSEVRAHSTNEGLLVVVVTALSDFRKCLQELLVIGGENIGLLVMPEASNEGTSLIVGDSLLLRVKRVPNLLLTLLSRSERIARLFKKLSFLTGVFLEFLSENSVLLILIEVRKSEQAANDSVSIFLLQRDALDDVAFGRAHFVVLEPF